MAKKLNPNCPNCRKPTGRHKKEYRATTCTRCGAKIEWVVFRSGDEVVGGFFHDRRNVTKS